jgi:hypothetical protein
MWNSVKIWVPAWSLSTIAWHRIANIGRKAFQRMRRACVSHLWRGTVDVMVLRWWATCCSMYRPSKGALFLVTPLPVPHLPGFFQHLQQPCYCFQHTFSYM